MKGDEPGTMGILLPGTSTCSTLITTCPQTHDMFAAKHAHRTRGHRPGNRHTAPVPRQPLALSMVSQRPLNGKGLQEAQVTAGGLSQALCVTQVEPCTNLTRHNVYQVSMHPPDT